MIPGVEMPVPELPVGDGRGVYLTFPTTSADLVNIYYHPELGAHEVHGAILRAYLSQNGPLGPLGYPISDEYSDSFHDSWSGRASDFQHGCIFWNRVTGQTYTLAIGPIEHVTESYEEVVGIDVSHYQGRIDWSSVTNAPNSDGDMIRFAYIKASEGDRNRDPCFKDNWQSSRGVLPRGAYHFFHAKRRPDETYAQVENFVGALTAAGGIGELPPMVDVERDSLSANISPVAAAESLQFFLSTVELALGVGQRPIIYTYPAIWVDSMADTDRFSNGYRLWIAHYGNRRSDGGYEMRTNPPALPGRWPDCVLWQHKIKPGVPGIGGLVDHNITLVPTGMGISQYMSQ